MVNVASRLEGLNKVDGTSIVQLWAMTDMLMRMLSPYQLNPMNANPLRQHLEQVVDFEALRAAGGGPALFVCATNVRTGRLRVFDRREITPAAVTPSACLPPVFQAVEVDGGH